MGDSLIIPPMRYAILVEGAVGRPGPYNFNPKFGVREYVAHAGGRTRTARDEDEIRIVDTSGKTRGWNKQTRLQPGDAILVPERNFSRPEIVQIVIATAGLLLSGVAITIAVTR
jgi:protein involved in polysaccharide export with SLBB domain